MYLTATTAAAILAFAASSAQAVSHAFVLNNCTESVWLTITNSTKQTIGPFERKSQEHWNGDIIGVGNSVVVSKNDQVYSNMTAKMTAGASTDNGILYWTISKSDGDPFAGESWSLTSKDSACGNATTYDGKVHACDDKDVQFALTFC